jgi:hypothetical protein
MKSRVPFNPRSFRYLRKSFQLSLTSFAPSPTLKISLYPFSDTPQATRMEILRIFPQQDLFNMIPSI